jgi:nitrate reductase gamma subunit
MSEFVLFVIAPYVAVACLLAGVLSALLARSPHARLAPPAVTARVLVRRNRVLALGVLGGLAGHALILGWPGQLARWSYPSSRLLILEAGLFLGGLAALAGLVISIARHVLRPRHERTPVVDVTFIGVLFIAVVSGLALPLLYRWAAAWSSVTLVPYVVSVASLQPELRFLESMPYLVKLHLFSSSVVVALVAFTTPSRVCLWAASRAIGRAVTPVGVAIGRTARLIQQRTRERAAHLIWSQDEAD